MDRIAKLKELLKNISLLVVSILSTFLVIEAGLRFFMPDKGGEFIAISFSKDFVKNDKITGLAGVPFAEGICHNCETKVTYKHNAFGFRDKKHSITKDSERYRVMVLGDSFVWGVGVEEDKTFARIFAEKDPRFDVMNVAVPGWSTVSEYLYLENRGLPYKPDMVVVSFCIENDAMSNGNFEREGFGDYKSLSPERKDESVLSMRYIHDHSRLYRLWKRKKRALKIERGLRPVLTEYDKSSPDWKATTKWIYKFKELCGKNNVELVFLIAPARNQFYLRKDADRPDRLLREYFASRNIKCLDLYPVFADYKKTHHDNWGYFRYDGHWNDLGHRLVAQALYDFIKK